MSEQHGHKLNHLQRLLPEGLLVNAAWLERYSYSRSLRSQYVSAGWLEQPARGVYRRPSGKLQWQHVVISLQTLLAVGVVVGGRTALELQGYAHYLAASGVREVHLHGDSRLPGWITKLDIEPRFVLHNAKKLFSEESVTSSLGRVNQETKGEAVVGNDFVRGSLIRQAWGHWDWPLVLSTPERAILELLDEVPQRESFHQADMLMEGLRTLSPRRIQILLEDCRSVKVKRLFLWFAERHQFQWLSQIDQARVYLGKGKRLLVRGGTLDRKYLITVPEELHGRQ